MQVSTVTWVDAAALPKADGAGSGKPQDEKGDRL